MLSGLKKYLIVPYLISFYLVCNTLSFSSPVRVDSVSHEGLVQDDEADLLLNPAYINNIDRHVIFSGFTFISESGRRTEEFPELDDKTVEKSSGYSVSPYIQYVMPCKIVKISVKYNPLFNKLKSEDNSNKTDSNSSEPVNFGLTAGTGIFQKTDIGISVSVNNSNSERSAVDKASNTYLSRNESKYRSFTSGFGVIFRKDADFSLGLTSGCVIAGENLKNAWITGESDFGLNTERTIYNVNAGIIPEFRFNSLLALRSYININYSWQYIDYRYHISLPRSKDFISNFNVSGKIGSGLVYKQDDGTLWSISVISDGIISGKNKYRYDDDTLSAGTCLNAESVFISRNLDLRAGIEKDILPGILKFRFALSPLKIDYMKQEHKETDQEGAGVKSDSIDDFAISGPVNFFSAGIGWKPAERMQIDINLTRTVAGYSRRTYNDYPEFFLHNYKEFEKKTGVNLNAAVTYVF